MNLTDLLSNDSTKTPNSFRNFNYKSDILSSILAIYAQAHLPENQHYPAKITSLQDVLQL